MFFTIIQATTTPGGQMSSKEIAAKRRQLTPARRQALEREFAIGEDFTIYDLAQAAPALFHRSDLPGPLIEVTAFLLLELRAGRVGWINSEHGGGTYFRRNVANDNE
jgi:hypothetical protein